MGPAVAFAILRVLGDMSLAPSMNSALTTCSLSLPKGAVDTRLQWAWWKPGWQCVYVDPTGHVVNVMRPNDVRVDG
jgi:hypothetical protein